MNKTELVTVDPSLLKTEERIVLAAMKVFSQYPLEVASLRMIAKEAGITLSLISYHFKVKENLYQEVLRRILSPMGEKFDKRFGILDSEQEISVERAKQVFVEVIGELSKKIFLHPHSPLFVKVIIQEHFSPSAYYDELYQDFFKKMIDGLARLSRIINPEIGERRSTLLAYGVIAQIIGYRMERELMVRQIGLEGYTQEEADEIAGLAIKNAMLAIQAEN